MQFLYHTIDIFSSDAVSPASFASVDNMGKVTIRNGLTSRGISALSPWNESTKTYSVLMINLGNNPISSLEIVSAINSFNLTYGTYYYYYRNRPEKYNPKVYLSAIQSVAYQWDYDEQNPEKTDPKWAAAGLQKSGSWPKFNLLKGY